ncbi:IS1 family transposase [Atlantibacter subterranea]|uniref:IS1 family transposase n=1 Tax=Atlantibacter subterraneus TaxID=255519 RepID=A0ABU4E271_9ENTR|nr:IS1 family transposase [Atlantibacter subterranea]MDV7023213.1 IS1 family transposase [Atlantibacter subterranea]MDZ5666155.1 IS1 family transposase [Atlantibacter hermannii]
MNAWAHVNCCKTIGCRLFGVANSARYLHIGRNCRCPECGYYFPFISPGSLSAFSQQSNHHYAGVVLCCPGCGQTDALVRHGQNAAGKQRWRCQACARTFTHYAGPVAWDEKLTPLREAIATGASFRLVYQDSQLIRRALSRLAFLAGLEQVHSSLASLNAEFSTTAFTVGFNGGENQLYLIVTADNKTGRVIALSTNYTALNQGIGQEWRYPSLPGEKQSTQSVIRQVFDKDRIIKQRPLLFDVAYGVAELKRDDAGVVVKPVIAAYRHFALVHALTHKRVLSVQHWLAHECFLYGACLMANRHDVVSQRSRIAFVYERGTRDDTQRLRSDTVVSSIIWRDSWRCYSQRHYEMAVCHLTGNPGNAAFLHATLQPAKAFQSWLAMHPVWPQLNRLAPRNVVALLEYLAAEYNRER